jgi:tRNA-5-methyluridine54 2-sulfurtransferase
MRCSRCKSDAVISSPSLCKNHFIDYFERRAFGTIKRYGLVRKTDRVCVAASGGKDSTAVLYLISKLKPKKLTALLIDEGIRGYRDRTISDLESFCAKHGIGLKMISFEEEFGSTLDKIIASKKLSLKPCSICGTLRRYLLNKHSKGFDVLVTGHNLDDEAQAVVMNLFRSQMDVLARLGPKTGIASHEGFVQRVKPLYLCTEKECALYSLLMGFGVSFNECPYVADAYRADIRDMLNMYESGRKGTKLNIVGSFLEFLPELKKGFAHASPNSCSSCGEPCAGGVCNACKMVAEIGR